jgi:hypothetical protein
MIFSNGQFDVENQRYRFDSKSKRFKKDKDGIPKNAIVIHYTGLYKSPETTIENIKEFTITLFDYGEPVEKVIGTISKRDPNEDYYSKVRYMIKRASELEKRKTTQID